MKFYHGTLKEYVPSILAEGLIPQKHIGARAFLARHNEKERKEIGHVFLSDSQELASLFADVNAYLTGGHPAVIEIDIPVADAKRDDRWTAGHWAQHAFYAKGNIAPGHVVGEVPYYNPNDLSLMGAAEFFGRWRGSIPIAA